MTPLIGHAEARAAFESAFQSGKMHHAWLLSGPRGIGKRTFATAAARMVLSGGESFDVPEGDRQASAFDADAHPDFRRLERGLTKTGDRLAQNITVGQVRDFLPVLNQTPSLSAWRVVMIDAACEMNIASANAFLKSLEEPPKQTVFLLVCHSPGRLLPTVRSRCRTLTFRPLPDAEVRTVLTQELDHAGDIDALIAVAGGAPGRALRFAGLEIGELSDQLAHLERADDATSRDLALSLGQKLALKAAQPRYEAFLELATGYLAGAAKRASPDQLEARLALWDEARILASDALAKSLDASVVTFQVARLVGRLTPGERQAA
ncbi:DNA polymerase III subunit delta' [Pacificimonas sp. WHA3]|uniref:DNA polymerase III subunit delta n=1 Tax=Pacificimonas pallii TaxID=2827236 RepID=A0ABS6SEY5_9SPHN|nr:DNA polymerase III subunit delta' [Pacificimonas pallii]